MSHAQHRARDIVSTQLIGAVTAVHLEVVSEVKLWKRIQHKNRNPSVERSVTLSLRPLGLAAQLATLHSPT